MGRQRDVLLLLLLHLLNYALRLALLLDSIFFPPFPSSPSTPPLPSLSGSRIPLRDIHQPLDLILPYLAGVGLYFGGKRRFWKSWHQSDRIRYRSSPRNSELWITPAHRHHYAISAPRRPLNPAIPRRLGALQILLRIDVALPTLRTRCFGLGG